MKRLEKIAAGFVQPINPYGCLILGFQTFFWGLWIVNPFWEVFTQAALYSKADSFAPEWAWGLWSTAAGLIILKGLWCGNYRMWVFALGFAMWHWWTIAGMLWWGDWQNTGGLTYSFIALYTTYAWLNMRVNKEYYEGIHFH